MRCRSVPSEISWYWDWRHDLNRLHGSCPRLSARSMVLALVYFSQIPFGNRPVAPPDHRRVAAQQQWVACVPQGTPPGTEHSHRPRVDAAPAGNYVHPGQARCRSAWTRSMRLGKRAGCAMLASPSAISSWKSAADDPRLRSMQPGDARSCRGRRHCAAGPVAAGRRDGVAVRGGELRCGLLPVRRDVLPGQGLRVAGAFTELMHAI